MADSYAARMQGSEGERCADRVAAIQREADELRERVKVLEEALDWIELDANNYDGAVDRDALGVLASIGKCARKALGKDS